MQKGQRALTIPVDLSGSLAGMLRPGDHVDILGTFARAQQDYATVTLLQNVLVLATGEMRGVGRERRGEPSGATGPRTFNNITVSVDPEEAELLVFAHAARPGQRGAALAGRRGDVRRRAGEELRRHLRAEAARRLRAPSRAPKKIDELKAQ